MDFMSLFADGVRSFFNLWIIGDRFLSRNINSLQITMNEARENPKLPQPYIQEYYNVKPYFQTSRDRVPARILNSLVDVINERQRLLRFLLVILDKDLLHDMNVCEEDIVKSIRQVTQWIVRQINITIRRARLQLMSA